ncbi:hypothetical protein ACQP1G_25665 [Nocardia sp. CA-107356]|uniref:hypothetical protein n=1 Tax=Nocardia sp. CA-107356 TaxID=3239972 RepID=UPI003D922396
MTVLAAVLQLLIAAVCAAESTVDFRCGLHADARAAAELHRQGLPATILADYHFSFDERLDRAALSIVIAVLMTVLAVLNIAANAWGLRLTWAIQPALFTGNALILYSELTAVKSVTSAFAGTNDPLLIRVDVPALLNAVARDDSHWAIPYLRQLRHTIIFCGSLGASLLVAMS